MLFPIGCALQEAQAKNEIFVRPTIFNIKIGPILRRERDLRLYQKELKKRCFYDWLDFIRININKNKVKFYSGEGNFFHDIENSNLMIKNWLFLNTLETPINNSGKIAVPVFDVISVIIYRLSRSHSLFIPDRSHLHYFLQNLGLCNSKVLLYITGIGVLLLFLGVLIEHTNRFFSFPIFLLLLFIYVWLKVFSRYSRFNI